MHLILNYDAFSISCINMCNGQIHYFCEKKKKKKNKT